MMLRWSERAACRSGDPEELFAKAPQQKKAKAVCVACPVRIDCLAEALDSRVAFGVWGGMTERERRTLLRRKPGVTSWRSVLEGARREHERPRVG
ncbi:WhiB family transcriptional regulator [Streptomyces sp. NPDC002889]|uniref:WhiB family transcriptional regulator n=1 Tax=Streptomyces sp. NPDC002889 TaxID=3364669 RepID=UPI0036BE84F6